jgi:AraC-like DNA-binding protein
MLAIPVPFVVALVLGVMIGQIVLRDRDVGLRWPLILFLAVAMLQAAIVGLRWSFDVTIARLIQPVTAALLPPMAYWAVSDLRRPVPRWTHNVLMPAVLAVGTAILVVAWPQPIDVVLFSIHLTYGVAILAVGFKSPDDLSFARLEDAATARVASLLLGGLLVSGAVLDAVIAIDLEFRDGVRTPMLISVVQLATLMVCALAAARIGYSRPATPVPIDPVEHGGDAASRYLPLIENTSQSAETHAEDAAILAQVDALLRERTLYRDPDLTLDRLARRAGLPVRSISSAVNRTYRVNVSQYVNGFRVSEAQALLRDTDRPVTAILFDVGFQTKSNFNREFKRVTGQSPSEWRAGNRAEG